MRSVLGAFAFVLLLGGCSGDGEELKTISQPGHGAVAIAVQPNPIVVRPAGGEHHDVVFDVLVTETAGYAVEVQQLVLHVQFAGANAYTLHYGVLDLQARGPTTSIPARGQVSFHFDARTRIPSKFALGALSGDISVVASDAAGAQAVAQIGIGIDAP